jgi:alpha-tubulin suppressor-like RCC1 family protein
MPRSLPSSSTFVPNQEININNYSLFDTIYASYQINNADVKFDFKNYHFIYSDNNNQLFSFGKNDLGQLGQNNLITSNVQKNVNLTLSFDEYVKKISVGLNHSLLLTSKGRLFAWGDNSFNQLGTGLNKPRFSSNPIEITTELTRNFDETILYIQAYGNYNLAYTSSKRFITWGASFPFGYSDDYGSKDVTSNLNFEGEIKFLKLGTAHGVVVTENNRIITFGTNYYNQLGFLTEKEYNTLDITDSFKLKANESIAKIDIDTHSNLVLTSFNRVFVWGNNHRNQLNTGSTSNVNKPEEITNNFNLLQNETIKDIDIGIFHGVAISSQNRIFSWGSIGYSTIRVLGDLNITESFSPIVLTNFSNNLDFEEIFVIAHVSDLNSYIFTSKGRVFAWGSNFNKQLAGLNNNRYSIPTLIGLRLDLD